jgi:hypothetical protein
MPMIHVRVATALREVARMEELAEVAVHQR